MIVDEMMVGVQVVEVSEVRLYGELLSDIYVEENMWLLSGLDLQIVQCQNVIT